MHRRFSYSGISAPNAQMLLGKQCHRNTTKRNTFVTCEFAKDAAVLWQCHIGVLHQLFQLWGTGSNSLSSRGPSMARCTSDSDNIFQIDDPGTPIMLQKISLHGTALSRLIPSNFGFSSSQKSPFFLPKGLAFFATQTVLNRSTRSTPRIETKKTGQTGGTKKNQHVQWL